MKEMHVLERYQRMKNTKYTVVLFLLRDQREKSSLVEKILKSIKHRPQLRKIPLEKSFSRANASEIHILGDFSLTVAG